MDIPVEQKVKKLFSKYTSIGYKKGEVILRPENHPQGIVYIRSGFVRMYQISKDGKELTLNIFKPGSYFPMIWAISNIENAYFFEAMTETFTYRAPKKAVIDLLKSDPEILFELTNRLVIGFYSLLSNAECLLSSNARERVSSILIILANRFGISQNDHILIKLPLTHEDLSRLAGLSRETTSIQMKKLMDKKLIFYKSRHITIIDMPKLQLQSYFRDY